MQTLDNLLQQNVKGKRVLVRVDFNVPIKNGKVGDTTRIRRVLPTIKKLADAGAKVLLLAHLGRPKGEENPEFTLEPVSKTLDNLLNGYNVLFNKEDIADGEISLLENIRFHAGEEKNDPDFIKELAKKGDIFVSEAFSAAHRAHASTVGIAEHLPTYAGLLMQEELEALEKALGNPEKPVMAIVGGAKVSTKIDLLKNLVSKVDKLAIGGGMANTFLFAQGFNIGTSLCEKDLAETARAILQEAKKTGCEILLPTDVVVADQFSEDAEVVNCPLEIMPADGMIVDIGDATLAAWNQAISESKTVVWNGPAGAFEIKPFSEGTMGLAAHIAERTIHHGLVSIAGGGDTVAALEMARVGDELTYISTAGGAFLEWMEGKELPGVKVLS